MNNGTTTTTKNKRRRWILIALALLLLLLFYLGIRSASAQLGFRGVLSETGKQIGDTFAFLGSYFRGEDVTLDRGPGEGGEGGESEEDTSSSYTELTPPTFGGAVILNPGSRLPLTAGTFIVNTNLLTSGDLQATGLSQFADAIAESLAATTIDTTTLTAGALATEALTSTEITTDRITIAEAFEALGVISAPGGILMLGSTLDLGGGEIVGLEYIRSIEAGENVVITEENGHYIISVPNIRSGGGGSRSTAGVASLNGQTGAISLIAGDDISISGLTINNTSTLESVRARGGCSSCILDSDVADNLTISGGMIDATVIGATTRAAGYFSNLSVGTTGTTSALVVDGDANFTGSLTADTGIFSGTVSGADAVLPNEFATLAQVQGMMGGPGGVAGVISLNALTGALTLTGEPGQITISTSGNVITLSLPQSLDPTASPTFNDLVLTGILTIGGNLAVAGDASIAGVVSADRFVSPPTDPSVRKPGEEILRMTLSIFPYPLPTDTGSSSFVRISRAFSGLDNPAASAPSAIPGTTRTYRFVIKYSDSIPSGVSSWRIYSPSTSTTIDSFTLPAVNSSDMAEPLVVVTDPVSVPSGDWQLEVSVPGGRMRVSDIHMVAFDVVD